MKWKKIALETTTEAVDLVSDLLNELGIDGIEIEDNVGISEEDRKKMFIDFLPEREPGRSVYPEPAAAEVFPVSAFQTI